MQKPGIRNMYPGGNTSLGFFSYYKYIIDHDRANRIFVIKGGPGTGKSSFMKRIGAEMHARGYDIEFMHCSSDCDSLDGLVIPALKVALLDGTAPHVVDPSTPGAIDEIINFGDFWMVQGFKSGRDEIIDITREISGLFRSVYKYLSAASQLYRDTEEVNAAASDDSAVAKLTEKMIADIFPKPHIADTFGRRRILFASAITPKGILNHLDTVLNVPQINMVSGQPGTGTEKALEKVADTAVARGLDVEQYMCALHPYKLEHIVIPQAGVAFTTNNKYHYAKADYGEYYDFDRTATRGDPEKERTRLQFNAETMDALLDRASMTVAQAKELHDKLETFYIRNMDFEEVDRCYEYILERILGYGA